VYTGIMEAIREIVDADSLMSVISLPENMKNHKVEVIVLPIPGEAPPSPVKSMKGFLKAYADPSLREKEKEAWGIAVREKYGNF
jgi:hypothetical protein